MARRLDLYFQRWFYHYCKLAEWQQSQLHRQCKPLYPNEPSGWDNSSPEHSLEPYILLWYVDDYWSLNDTSNDILKYYKPERIGYLCEFD